MALTDTIAVRLMASGMARGAAVDKEQLFARADSAIRGLDGLAPNPSDIRRFWVPGRIEFLGKHTDYAGGRSLLCAVERGLAVVVTPRVDQRVRVRDGRSGDTADGTLDASLVVPTAHWSAYPFTVARRLARDFPTERGLPLVGANIAFASDLPIAAGISSSSALVVATFLALAEVNDLALRADYRREIGSRESLGGYLGAVENGLGFGRLAGDRGVGTFGGSEDQTAILCARAGMLVQYSFCPVRFERAVPLPTDHTFLIMSSGVAAHKTGAALESYNRAATLARAAMARGPIGQFRTEELAERATQFLIESDEIIPAAADALAHGHSSELGMLVDRSMENATQLLHNQIEETVFLARRARELGATAASAFGAGFGGSVWALIRHDDAKALAEHLLREYATRFPTSAGNAEFFLTGAGPAALQL